MRLSINLVHCTQLVIWKAQGVPQSELMQPIPCAKRKKHRVAFSNRIFKCSICHYSNDQVSCSFIITLAGLTDELLLVQMSSLSKSKQEKLTMLTQLPFYKNKDFLHQHSS